MTTYKISDIDLTKMAVAKVRDNAKMRSFFIDYDGGLFTVQTPQMLLDWGGIPQQDEYHPTDADRRYVLYSIHPQPMSKTFERAEEYHKREDQLADLRIFLEKLEDWAESDAVKKKLFGDGRCEFMPIIKHGTSDEYPSKFKLKFYADRETGDPDFVLCRRNPETKKREFELTDGLSLEDLRKKVFRYMGTQRLIFQMRGWTDKLTKKKPRYGLTLIIKSVEYAPPIKRKPQEPKPEMGFIDSDSDEETEPQKPKSTIKFIDSDEEEKLQNAEDDY